MRDGPPTEVLAGSVAWVPRAASWRAGELLAESVPVVSGSLSVDSSQQVPERLGFVVPDFDRGASWVPDGPDHPLSEFGQEIHPEIVTRSAVSGEEWVTRLGRYLIVGWEHDDDAGIVSVECVGLLHRAEQARFRAPEVPRPDSTLASELRRLMVPGVPVQVSGSLVDRACPRSMDWPEDRLGALWEIADAWPARLRVDEDGVLQVLPPLSDEPGEPVLELTDGEGGTVVSAPGAGTRDRVYNVVVARSQGTDDPARPPLQHVAEVLVGPLRPEVFGEVVRYWSSPLATTAAMLRASAETLLATSIRPAVSQRVTLAPDPRIEVDDVVSVTRDGRTVTGWVTAVDLPLGVGDGAMSVTVGLGRREEL